MQNYDVNNLFPKFSVVEGLKTYDGNDYNVTYTELQKTIENSNTLGDNINKLAADSKTAIGNDILDDDGKLITKGRLVDVARQDVQTMLIQQNTLYMVGTITIATLLITAILISK